MAQRAIGHRSFVGAVLVARSDGSVERSTSMLPLRLSTTRVPMCFEQLPQHPFADAAARDAATFRVPQPPAGAGLRRRVPQMRIGVRQHFAFRFGVVLRDVERIRVASPDSRSAVSAKST